VCTGGGGRRPTVADACELAGVPRFRAGERDFECALHREVARVTAKLSRTVLLAKIGWGRRTVRRGGAARRRSSDERAWSTHGAGRPPHLQAHLRDNSSTAKRRRQRRSAVAARARVPTKLGAGEGGC
jgi:hypothetical protein